MVKSHQHVKKIVWLSTSGSLYSVPFLTCCAAHRERARQTRANRIAHAVEQLDSDDKENSADAGQLQRPLYSLLEPAETALVEQLLAQVMPQKKRERIRN